MTTYYDEAPPVPVLNGEHEPPRKRVPRLDIRMAKDSIVGPTLANELREHAEALLEQAVDTGLTAAQQRTLKGRARVVERFAAEIEEFHGEDGA